MILTEAELQERFNVYLQMHLSSQISITENLLCGFYQLDFFTSHYSKNNLQGLTVKVFFPVLVAARFHNADHMRFVH